MITVPRRGRGKRMMSLRQAWAIRGRLCLTKTEKKKKQINVAVQGFKCLMYSVRTQV